MCLGAVDLEDHVGADRVPVKLVIGGEEAELASCRVADHVGMFADRHVPVGVADPEAHAIVDRFARIMLGLAVPLDALDLEADVDAVAVALVAGREIAGDAVTDLLAFDIHAERLGDVKGRHWH